MQMASVAKTIERLLSVFWISEQKHLKVIHRGLDLVAWQGEHFIRQEVLKLFFIHASGCDCGNAIGTIISGGAETVMSGGVETNDTILSGGLTVLTGGQANGTIVSSGGFMNLGQGPFNGQPGMFLCTMNFLPITKPGRSWRRRTPCSPSTERA